MPTDKPLSQMGSVGEIDFNSLSESPTQDTANIQEIDFDNLDATKYQSREKFDQMKDDDRESDTDLTAWYAHTQITTPYGKAPEIFNPLIKGLADILINKLPHGLATIGTQLGGPQPGQGGVIPIIPPEEQRKQAAIRENLQKAVYESSSAFSKQIEQAFPNIPGTEGNFWLDQLPRGFGSLAGFAAASWALGPASAGIVGAVAEGQSMATEAYETSGDVSKANLAFGIGLPIGATEALPIASVFKKIKALNPAANKMLRTIVTDSIVQGSEEALQESFQTFAENVTAKELYDANRDLSQGMFEGGAVGFITGATMAALGMSAKYLNDKHGIKDATKTLSEQSNTLNKIIEKTNDYSEDASLIHGYKDVFNFANNPRQDLVLDSEEAKSRGRESLQVDSGVNIKQTFDELNTLPDANILDATYIYGKKNLDSYIRGANSALTDKKIVSPILKSNIPFSEIHKVNTNIYNKALGAASSSALADNFMVDLSNGNTFEKQLRNDLMVGVAMNFGEDGWNLIRQRYANVDPNIVAQGIAVAQSATSDQLYGDLFKETQNIFDTETIKIRDFLETQSLNNASQDFNSNNNYLVENQDEGGNYLFEPDYDPMEGLARTLGNDLGYKFEGIQRFKSEGLSDLYMYTHPRTGSTLSFTEDQLTSDVIKQKMEDNAAKFDKARMLFEQDSEAELPPLFTPAQGETIFQKEGKWYRTYESGTGAEMYVSPEELDKETEITDQEARNSFTKMNKDLAKQDIERIMKGGIATQLNESQMLFEPNDTEEDILKSSTIIANRLSEIFPNKDQYTNDMIEATSNTFETQNLWNKPALSSMGPLEFLRINENPKDDFENRIYRYPKDKEELADLVKKDIYRNIDQNAAEQYWKNKLENVSDETKELISQWAFATNTKFYSSDYGKPSFDFNALKFPELPTKPGEKPYTKWASAISTFLQGTGIGSRYDIYSPDLFLSDSNKGIINWYKTLTNDKIKENLNRLAKALAFKHMVVKMHGMDFGISNATDPRNQLAEKMLVEYYKNKLMGKEIAEIGPSIDQLFESEFSTRPNQGGFNYGTMLSGFTGDTVSDLFNYLHDNNIVSEDIKALKLLLSPLVGDLPVKVQNIFVNGKSKRGAYVTIEGRGEIWINPNINVSSPSFLYKTVVHEAIHAWTYNFMKSGSKRSNDFNNRLNTLRQHIQKALQNPSDKSGVANYDGPSLSGLSKSRIEYYLTNNDEFISAIMAADPAFITVLSRVNFKEDVQVGKESALRRFFKTLFNFLSEALGKNIPNSSVLVEFQGIMEDYYNDIRDFHFIQLGKELPSVRKLREQRRKERAYYLNEEIPNDLDTLSDNLDPEQEEESTSETIAEIATVKGFTEFIATLKNITPAQYYKQLKSMTPLAALKDLDELDEKFDKVVDLRLRKLFKSQYSKKFNRSTAEDRKVRDEENYRDFKLSMIVKKLNRAQETSAKPHYSVITTKHGDKSSSTEFVRLQENFRTPDGTTGNVNRESITLEGFIKPFEDILGLREEGDTEPILELVFINSFEVYESYKAGRLSRFITSKNINRLNKQDIGVDKGSEETLSQHLATLARNSTDKVNNKRFIYLGNFGGKNTLPFLSIREDKYAQFEDKIAEAWSVYSEALGKDNRFDFTGDAKRSYAIASTTRALLEDMWYGVDFSTFKNEGSFNSIIIHQDFNKIAKRGGKWAHAHTMTQEDSEYIKTIMPRNKPYSGIRYDDATKQIKVKVAIFNAYSEGSVEVDGQQIELKDCMVNTLGTPTTDGASFYIIGEFDKVYHGVHGTLKDGTLKNVVSSQYGDRPLFIKHAMHGLHYSDPLAKWMKANGIAVLVSSESAKIGKEAIVKDNEGKTLPSSGYGQYDLAEIAVNKAIEDNERVIELPIRYFHAIKEEQNLSSMGGTTRQTWNGTAVIEQNPALNAADSDGSLTDIVLSLMGSIGNNFTESSSTIDTEKMLLSLKDIVDNPASPKQVAISNILKAPFEELNMEELTREYGNFLHHPMIAEHINRKLKEPLQKALQMIIPGYRAALCPSIGILAKSSQIDPITTEQNQRWLLTSLPISDKIFKEALPEDDIRQLVVDKRMLQRDISLYLSKGKRDLVEEARAELDKVNAKLEELANSYIAEEKAKEAPDKDRIKRLKSGIDRTFAFVDIKKPRVQNYLENLMTKIIGPGGRINNGYTLITQDDASRFGVKPGDRVLLIVTPTDSALSVTSATVAAILPTGGVNKISGNNKIIVNSEYIQKMVGKDFDIDTIAVIPYDMDYWNPESFNKLLDIMALSNKKYVSLIKSTMMDTFNKAGYNIESLSDEDIFNDEYRIAYAQIMNGQRTDLSKPVYAAIGNDFHIINDAYNADVSAIINSRLYHTALSAIGLKAMDVEMPMMRRDKIESYAKITFSVNHPNWFQTHLLHLIMTNHFVDFPNNTSKLLYNSDLNDPATKRIMFKHFWGISDIDMEKIPDYYVDALDEFTKILFDRAFFLAKDQDPITKGRATYFDSLEGISAERSILSSLFTGDKQQIKELYERYLNKTLNDLRDRFNTPTSSDWWKKIVAQATIKKAFIDNFIDKLEAPKVLNYGLFSLIGNIDPSITPIYGLTQKEALATEAFTAWDIASSYPYIKNLINKHIVAQMRSGKATYFTDKNSNSRNPVYPAYTISKGENTQQPINPDVTTIALSLLPKERDYQEKRQPVLAQKGGTTTYGNGPLEKAQKASVAILHGFDEVESTGTPSPDELVNRTARATAFPILIRKMLEKSFVRFSGNAKEAILDTGKGKITLRSDTSGRLLIIAGNEAYYGSQVLEGTTDASMRLMKLLTTEDGIWNKYENRLAFSKLIRIPDNISIDERKELLKQYVDENIYNNPKLSRMDHYIYWISFMGQLTNRGLADDRVYGMQIVRAQMDPTRPYTYAYNNVLLELLSQYEPRMRDEFIFYYNRHVDTINRANVEELSQAIRDKGITDSSLLFEPDFEEENTPAEFIDMLHAKLDNMNMSTFKTKEYMEFSKLTKKDYKAAYEKLKTLVDDEALLRALAESGYEVSSVLNDVRTLTPAQFKSKYDNIKLGALHDAFNRYEEVALGRLNFELDLNPSTAKLRQLFYVFSDVKNNELRDDKDITAMHQTLLSARMFDDYGPLNEKKTYAFSDEDEKIGFIMKAESTDPTNITRKELDTRTSILATTIPRVHGESTLTWTKSTALKKALAGKAQAMSSHLDQVNLINLAMTKRKIAKRQRSRLRDTNLISILNQYMLDNKDTSKDSLYSASVRERVFKTAEDMKDKKGITVSQNENGTYSYRIDNLIYDENLGKGIYDLLNDKFPNMSAEDKLIFLQAIEYRKLYDIEARKVIQSAIKYLQSTLEDFLSEHGRTGEEAEYIRSLLDRYYEYMDALDKRSGNYMPHQFPIEMFKIMWEKQYRGMILNSILADINFHKRLREQGATNYNAKLANMTDAEANILAERKLEEGWRRVEMGNPGPAFIPNFQQRWIEDPDVKYNTVSSKVHENYVGRLTKGLEKDLLMADWYLYLNKARAKGESKRIINATRWWYANQITNKLLHSKQISIDKLKKRKGAEISFLITGEKNDPAVGPVRTEVRISGILESINLKDGTIKLFVDVPKRRYEIRKKLLRAEEINNSIISNDINGLATPDQLIFIDELVKDGYMKPLAKAEYSILTMKDASNLIVGSLRSALDNPAKLGLYNIADTYTKDLQGKTLRNNVDIFLRRGAAEYLDSRARELSNLKLLNGTLDNKMDEANYMFYKGVGTSLRTTSKVYRKTIGYAVLAGWNSMKALARNAYGWFFSSTTYSPIKMLSYMWRARSEFKAISHGVMQRMDEEQQMIYNVMASLSITNSNDIMQLTLGRLNISQEESIGVGSDIQKLRYIAKVWSDASGYNKYVTQLTELEKELRQAKEGESYPIVTKIRRLKLKWRAQVEGLLSGNETDAEVNEAIKNVLAKDPKDLKMNLAEQEGVTKSMAAKMFFKQLGRSLYNGAWWFPFGLKIQSLAEYGRRYTFLAGYLLARDNGFSIDQSLQAAINYTEATNAFYGPENRQLGAGTAGGKALHQFSQYTYSSISHQMRLVKDAIVQHIGQNEDDKPAWQKIVDGLQSDITTVEEVKRNAMDKTHVTRDDINILKALTVRWVTGLMALQLGYTMTIKGLQYVQDPAVQLGYKIWDLIIGLLTGTGADDEEEAKQEALDILYDATFMYGVPARQVESILLAPEDQDVLETLTVGRIQGQFGTMGRFYNSMRVALGDDEMTRDEQKKTFFNDKFLVNEFLFGLGIIGTYVRSEDENEYQSGDVFFGAGDTKTFPGYRRPLDEEKDYYTPDERFVNIFLKAHKNLFPSGDRLFK